MTLWDEILSQPQVLRGFIEEHWGEVEGVARWLGSVDFSYAAMAARGSSDNAARYAQYLWGAHNHLNVALAAPSLYTLFHSPPSLSDALVVGISQSGESPDLLAVLRSGLDQGRPTLAITNSPSSPMAHTADRHLDLAAGLEKAVAATKSYTSQLLAIAALSAAISGDEKMIRSLQMIPEAVSQVLAASDNIGVLSIADQSRCAVLGRGYNHSTAFEWALKISELTYVSAHPFSAADFRHGPIAMVEPGFVVLAVATSGLVFNDVAELLQVVRDKGAVVVAITDRDDCPADLTIPIPSGIPEWLTPIPATVAAQVFTYRLARARGVDPDHPRGLHKVTRTE